MVYDVSDVRFSRGRRRSEPQSFLDQKAASSRAGQVFHEMASRQGRMTSPDYTASESEVARLKELRRDWNRNLKNTPMGIMASGVDLGADPFGAQDLYHDMSSQLAYDAPAAYDEMYPFQPGKLISGLAENVGPFGWLNRMIPKRERITPENVLAMRKRFPGIDPSIKPRIDELVPPTGLANLVPEYQRQKALFDINETVEGGAGIFGGTGQSALEEPDLEKYIPPINDRALAEWFIAAKPEADLTVERAEELIRDLEPTTKQFLIEQYKESQ